MILVTGATGHVGRELADALVTAGRPVRALSRGRAGPGEADLPPGVDRAIGDLDHAESLTPALQGVERVFLLGGYRDMPAVVDAIRRAGARHIVLLTSRSVVGGSPTNAIVEMWNISEDAVRGSGLEWTILRPTGFMSNALRWAPQLRAGHVIRAPFANAAVAQIDPFDIAAAAAVTLTTDGHASQSYALSGPEAMRPADTVRVLGTVLGRDLRFEAQPDDEARREMSRSMDPRMVDAFFRFFAQGEFDDSPVVSTVQDLTGRAPRTFEQWARAHADAFPAATSSRHA